MGILSWYGITIGAKVVMIQQNYEAITGVNYRADTKRFTQGGGGYFHIWSSWVAWPQILPLKFLVEPQTFPPKIKMKNTSNFAL